MNMLRLFDIFFDVLNGLFIGVVYTVVFLLGYYVIQLGLEYGIFLR